MELVVDKLINNKKNWINVLQENFKQKIEEISSDILLSVNYLMEESVCPNCWNDSIDWLCQDDENCWYWHWENFSELILNELEKKRITYYFKEENKLNVNFNWNWNWEKVEIVVLWLIRHIYLYNYKSRIKENEWIIEFNDNNKRYKVSFWYKFSEINNFHEKSWKNKIIKDKNIDLKYQKWLRWKLKVLEKKWNKWTPVYYEYHDLYLIIKSILLDKKFNKFI